MWYATSCMTNLSMENFGNTCIVSLGVGIVFYFVLFACMHIYFFAFLPYFLTCFVFLFTSALCFIIHFLVYICRLVSHEILCNSKDKQGKLQEDLYNYQRLVICCLLSLCRTCCLLSMIHQWKIHYVRSESWWKQNTCALTSTTYSNRLILG